MRILHSGPAPSHGVAAAVSNAMTDPARAGPSCDLLAAVAAADALNA